MTCKDALKQLKAMGTVQNRKVYGRHGMKGDLYGVSYANLKKVAREIKVDHALARQLWETGNCDARTLATMVADPSSITKSLADAWARDLDNYGIADAFSSLVARSPHCQTRMEKWSTSKGEWIGRSGWQLLAHLAMSDTGLPDSYFELHLATIENEIHTRKNRVRDAMNSALIAIGIRNPKLEKKALAAAKRIGQIEVDHGQTSCKTPDAGTYIHKTLERRRKKRAS